VVAVGGLHVVGTERHESQRIYNQGARGGGILLHVDEKRTIATVSTRMQLQRNRGGSAGSGKCTELRNGESTHQEDYRGKHHLVATNEMKFCLDASPKQKLISKFKRGTFTPCRWDANQIVLVLVGFALGLQKEED
ncbi:hypothetical protein S245_067292, partial [Arachis hypogaea]